MLSKARTSVWMLSLMFVRAAETSDKFDSSSHQPSDTLNPEERPNNHDRIVQRIKSQDTESIGRIIESLSGLYDISFHYRNSTEAMIDELLQNNTGSIYTLNNYDRLNACRIKNVGTRPVLHLIILRDPLIFSELFHNNLRSFDVVIFINERSKTIEQIMGDDVLKRIHAAYILSIRDSIELFNICEYCGVYSRKLNLIHEAQIQNPLSVIDALINSINRQFHNFHGHKFRVAFTNGESYFQCKNMTKYLQASGETVSICNSTWGIESSSLYELGRVMNFTVELVTGPPIPNVGEWSKTILDVNHTWAEWAIGGISFTEERLKMVDFSASFGKDPLRILYAVIDDDLQSGLDLVLSFSWITWLALGLSLMILSILLSKSSNLPFLYSLQINLRILLEQSVENTRKFHGRFFLTSWILCCVIISTAYKAKISALAIGPHSIAKWSIADMAENNYVTHLNKLDPTVSFDYLKSSHDPTLVKLSENVRSDLDICQALKDVLKSKSMLLEEQIAFLMTYNSICTLTHEEIERLQLFPEELFPADHGWPFRKKTPILETFNVYILRLFESGIYDKWLTDNLHETTKGTLPLLMKSYSSSQKVYRLKEFIGPILAWASGLTLSLLCFILEMCVPKLLKYLKIIIVNSLRDL